MPTACTSSCKKILLTGGIDKEKIAIEAFNKGIIHRFINKADTNFPAQLKQAITVLKEAYFKDLTHSLLPYLPITSTQLLQNSAFVNFVYHLQHQIKACEYYLLDASGSSIFLDADGSPTWLIVKSENELANYEQIAKDMEGSEALIESIAKRQKIPFFFSDTDYQSPVTHWDQYLYLAQPMLSIQGHYYALIKGHIRDNLDKKRLTIKREIDDFQFR